MSEGKTVPVKVRVAWDDVVSLNKLCEEKGYKQTDAIRKAIRDFILKEQRTQKEWSPVQEYNLQKPEPGQGYDETKSRWNPELITSYAEKVRARQRDRQ